MMQNPFDLLNWLNPKWSLSQSTESLQIVINKTNLVCDKTLETS